MTSIQKITPFLWFDNQAEEAANFYTAIFQNSNIERVSRNGEQVMAVSFLLEGQKFSALNGGPMFKFNPAVSFMVSCSDQAEVDFFWDKLTADGGEESRCGWLKDKFGLSWQIIPEALPRLLSDPDPAVAKYAMAAMLQMQKIEIDKLTQIHV